MATSASASKKATAKTNLTYHSFAAGDPKSTSSECEFDNSCCGAVIRNTESAYGGLGGIPSDTLIYRATEIFSALADSTRFKILCALMAGELCVHELVEICEVSQSAVSHQLRLLKDRGLLNSQRNGQKIAYSFADDHVRSLILVGLEHADEYVAN